MKIKGDFVTNSSSASFIMIIEAPYDDVHCFREAFNDYLNYYKSQTGDHLRFWDASNISEVSDHVFQITDWTSMYNGIYDIPKYMQHIILDSVASPQSDLECRGMKFKSFDVEEDN